MNLAEACSACTEALAAARSAVVLQDGVSLYACTWPPSDPRWILLQAYWRVDGCEPGDESCTFAPTDTDTIARSCVYFAKMVAERVTRDLASHKTPQAPTEAGA